MCFILFCHKCLQFLSPQLLVVNFSVDTTQMFSDSDGDPGLGCDITYWNTGWR